MSQPGRQAVEESSSGRGGRAIRPTLRIWGVCSPVGWWPGLATAWQTGRWSALAVAVGFTVLANGAVVATWIYSDLLILPARLGLWGALVIWAGASAVTRSSHRRDLAEGAGEPAASPLFPEALGEYLRGNWLAAERALRRLLDREAHDVEARLLLATLLRHVGRADEARRQLQHLAGLPEAGRWEWEIREERRRLDEIRAGDTVAGPLGWAASGSGDRQAA